ncbi:hypothetical protein [Amaricoccus macauensis]|uniref:hypothetical protein n=1 Tax=Amaricoccus macauensis TaxID=57001 RepID=UPI003C7AFCC3
MTNIARSFALAAAVIASGASIASAETLGDRVAKGAISEAAFQQLIAQTGLNAEEASAKTVNEVVHLRIRDE